MSGITVNTNMQALRIQTNLNVATSKMNTAMERMASGSKINSAKDDAAGLAVSTKLSTTISSSQIASNNVAIGSNLLDTAEGTLDVVTQNLQRIRDLTDQASNGTYSTSDLKAIAAEVTARITEVDALATSSNFNGIKLFNGNSGITLQVGTGSGDSLKLDSTIFASVGMATSLSGLSAAITGGVSSATAAFLDTIDNTLSAITTRVTNIGAAQNQLQAVSDGLTVQTTNLSAARSTITDADIAQESASYVQQQILQQASASLLVQANSAPQIALTLIKG